jgi:hypothetical protein
MGEREPVRGLREEKMPISTTKRCDLVALFR